MKRLLASGAPNLYQVARVFRNGESGKLHNPEFTLVEWYERDAGYDRGIELLSHLADRLLSCGSADILTWSEAFRRHVGVDPHQAGPIELRAAARRLDCHVPASIPDSDRDGLLNLLLVTCVEPNLGKGRPAILCDYPVGQAALARIRPGPPPVAERFELYVNGIELANGYHELLDADVLRQRNLDANAWRRRDGKPALPADSRLLEAMRAGLPPCAGAALGFDRLVMAATGANHVSEVLPFPIDRA